ncbi:hypothetical protein P7C71_g1587, partial [Lecanoromycetidae sp. Uapishka_2]
MDRAQTPAFGLASSLEAMIESSLATSLERRLTSALNQRLGLDGSSLEDRISALVNVAVEQRLGSGTLNSLIQGQLSGILDQRFGHLTAVLDSRIRFAVDAAIQHRLGTSVRAQITFDVPLQQTVSPALSQDRTTSLSLGSDTSTVPCQYHTVERDGSATVNQQIEHEISIYDSKVEELVDVPIQEILERSSSLGNTIVAEKTTSVKRESPLKELVPTVEKQTLLSVSIPGTKAESDIVTKPRAQARKETSNKPIVLPGMGIQFPVYQPPLFLEQAVIDVTQDDASLFVEQDETKARPETPEGMHLTSTGRKSDAMQERLPASQDRTLSNKFATLLREYQNGNKVAELEDHTTCAKCGSPPDDAHVISCFHVYCEECLAALAYNASLGDKDEIACVKCLAVCIEAEPVFGLLADFAEKSSAIQIEDAHVEPVEKSKKPSKKRTSTPAVSEKSDAEAPMRKKPKKTNDQSDAGEGPSIKFLSKRASKLTSAAHKRGHPRIVDISTFSEETDKQNLTMADVVATSLWKYKPEALQAFLDVGIYPTFRFVVRDATSEVGDFAIERESSESGPIVRCGYLHRAEDDQKLKATKWAVSYEYFIKENGLWAPHAHKRNDNIQSVNRAVINQAAAELGTELFLRKIWTENEGIEISATLWTPEDASKGNSIFTEQRGGKADGKKLSSGKKENGK